ncbi:MAG: hypothetical protein GY749_47050 [Desulfobacteraceae bacterium]|nr:hypothetical protein [Desulfobacteraceae bacterium]
MAGEKEYKTEWCRKNNGKPEVRFQDGTRCDCITEYNAVEIEFGNKWYETVGQQSLHYAIQSGKKAGIAIILEKETDKKYWTRMIHVIKTYKLPIDTWIIK